MTPSQSFITHWYFHVPNLILVALIYALIGRCILSLIFGMDSDKSIVRVCNRITNPVVKAVGAVTPRIVPAGLVVVFAVVWLFLARVVLFFAVTLMGVRPVLS